MVAEKPIDAEAYRQMQNDGEFIGLRPAVELFGGKVVQCRTVELADSSTLTALAQWSTSTASPKRHRVLIQSSILLGDTSVLRPSMAWCSMDNRTEEPQVENLELVIEAPRCRPDAGQPDQSCLEKRRNTYAAAGVTEYWLIDVDQRNVIVHRSLVNGSYTIVVNHNEGESITPQCEPAAHLELHRLFPK